MVIDSGKEAEMRESNIERLGSLVDRIVTSSEKNYQQWLTCAIEDIRASSTSVDEDVDHASTDSFGSTQHRQESETLR